ncbi:LysM peptidoglycan-binding domain-containing protein [Pseudohongiella acticola]|uniref:LysM peptidoglycan-binding domain-containing protein n=1 Tax=Pseudohongiella acticola TaxID=1524254 RepID=UPI000A7B9479|nr:LysM peptidoglycan-binding domain-containing protein [Pseudohongiella acticola]
MNADPRLTPATRPPDISRRTTTPGTRFRLKPLSLLIASGIFLQACSSLPSSTQVDEDNASTGNRIERTAGNTRNNRQRGVVINPGTVELSPQPEALPSHADTVWYRVSNGLQFALDYHNEQIEDEIEWFRDNPGYIAEVTERATPFIYEIVQEVERRGLPLELALLPIVESAFNPMARSSQSAAGLWQFMAPTAASLGLKRDWWYDGRHDPMAATSAALDYLQALHAQFDEDWLLALAAYNAGQGNLQRAIRSNRDDGLATDFWSLPLPAETVRHVPRLLGLAHVMADPDHFELTLSVVPDQPYVHAYDVGAQIDLGLVATLAELEPELIYQLNPGYLQWATHPDGPHTVLLPVGSVPAFEQNLAELGDSHITWDRYTIQSGDTLSGIAARFGTQINVLQQTNNLTGSRIVAGDSLLIPRAYHPGETPLSASGLLAVANTPTVPAGQYTVRSGDSLWRIANRYQLTVNEIATWNDIATDSVLRPGQRLRLEPDTLATADANGTSNNPSALQYEVRQGDSLARIAREHGVSIEDITRWNQIGRRSLIHPGQELVLYID